MNVQRLLEIVDNKEYERVEFHDDNDDVTDSYYIDIYTKNGAFIEVTYGWEIKNLFFKEYKVDYCRVSFFVPEFDYAIKSFTIYEDENMYKTLIDLKDTINKQSFDKYF